MTNDQNQSYEEMMKNAQYRKSRGIAFFNANNSAIEIVRAALEGLTPEEKDKPEIGKRIQDRIVFWRDWFLAEYDKDYAKNIAPIGLGSVDPKVMNGLDKAKEAYANSQGSQPGN